MKGLFFYFTVAAMLVGCTGISKQVTVPEIYWSFDLPTAYNQVPVADLGNGVSMYRFKREPIVDASGLAVHPNIGFVIEDVPAGTDPVLFSASKRRFKVLEVYSPTSGIFSINAIGYLAEYEETIDGKSYLHHIYVLHAVQGAKGIEVILDATQSVFAEVQDEFLSVLKSLRQSGSK